MALADRNYFILLSFYSISLSSFSIFSVRLFKYTCIATFGPPDLLDGPDDVLVMLFFLKELNWGIRNLLKFLSLRPETPGVVLIGPLSTGFNSFSFKSYLAFCSVYDELANLLNAPCRTIDFRF